MKILISIVFVSLVFFTEAAKAGNIVYGYNAHGDYVPTEIDGKKVTYGYNAHGDYVPTAIGNDNIDYGYNAHGDYVPTSVGNNRINYGYNAHGDYVPTAVGNDNINYGYNAMVTMSPHPSATTVLITVIMRKAIMRPCFLATDKHF